MNTCNFFLSGDETTRPSNALLNFGEGVLEDRAPLLQVPAQGREWRGDWVSFQEGPEFADSGCSTVVSPQPRSGSHVGGGTDTGVLDCGSVIYRPSITSSKCISMGDSHVSVRLVPSFCLVPSVGDRCWGRGRKRDHLKNTITLALQATLVFCSVDDTQSPEG